MTLAFAKPDYPGGRHLLKSGSVNVGAVFPPASDSRWEWRLFITEMGAPAHGEAKTEEAAKRALRERFKTFLAPAELEVRDAL